jgi:methylated-DNA-[protein]-cysteine S-methyltransferase
VTVLQWATVDVPTGQVSVGCTDQGVAEVRFDAPPANSDAAGPSGLAADAQAQLAEYFEGRREEFDLPLDWTGVRGARLDILTLLAGSVPYGQTVTYGQLAQRLADRNGRRNVGSRAVGQFMGSNPIPVIVPCHRVVAADGLGGFSGGCGIELKRWLLTFEGALPAMLDFGAPLLPAG